MSFQRDADKPGELQGDIARYLACASPAYVQRFLASVSRFTRRAVCGIGPWMSMMSTASLGTATAQIVVALRLAGKQIYLLLSLILSIIISLARLGFLLFEWEESVAPAPKLYPAYKAPCPFAFVS